MAGYFEGKVVAVIGGGDEAHRAVAMALAQAGADVAIAGQAADLSAEAALHSIANEVWAIGRRAVVTTIAGEDTAAFGQAMATVQQELGGLDLTVRCDPVLGV
jgi:NAD(P)-dependent dehydrogenase (short-subunit alcohol dehydrogenase family)